MRLQFFAVSVVLCVFFSSCQTVEFIGDSLNNEKEPTEKPELVSDNRPGWKDENNGYSYYIGKSIGTRNTREDAYREAKNQVHTSLSGEIGAKVRASATIQTMSRDDRVREEARLNLFVSSPVSYQGLEEVEVYWELWRKTAGGGKNKEITNWYSYYVKMRIPTAEIEKAQERFMNGESLADAEKKILEDAGRNYREIVSDLEGLNFDDSNARVRYGIRYNDLVALSASLSGLVAIREDPEKIREIEELTMQIKDKIRLYEPVNKTDQIIRYLTDKLQRKESELNALGQSRAAMDLIKSELMQEIRTMNSGSLGPAYITSSNYFFTPSVPSLVRSESGAYVSRDFVKNKDIAAFLAAHGMERVLEFSRLPNDPAVNISYRDAALFCNWLSASFGLDECYVFTGDVINIHNNNGYRLPGQAELEGAYRASSLINNGDLVEWYYGGDGKAHAVQWRNDRLTAFPLNDDIRLEDVLPTIGFRVARNAR